MDLLHAPSAPPLLCGMDWKPWTSAARSRGFAVQQMLTLSVSRFYTRDLWASAFSPNSGQLPVVPLAARGQARQQHDGFR